MVGGLGLIALFFVTMPLTPRRHLALARGRRSVAEGEVVTLLGRNGAGRTSTLRAIMGLIGSRKGSIKVRGTETIGMSTHAIARLGLGYCPEERGIFASLSAEENLLLPPQLAPGGIVPPALVSVLGGIGGFVNNDCLQAGLDGSLHPDGGCGFTTEEGTHAVAEPSHVLLEGPEEFPRTHKVLPAGQHLAAQQAPALHAVVDAVARAVVRRVRHTAQLLRGGVLRLDGRDDNNSGYDHKHDFGFSDVFSSDVHRCGRKLRFKRKRFTAASCNQRKQ